MRDAGSIRLPKGVKIPDAGSFTTIAPGAARPADYPGELPFLAEYHCQFGTTTDMAICIWSTSAPASSGTLGDPMAALTTLLMLRAADASRRDASLAAGTSLRDAVIAHFDAQGWSSDTTAFNALPFPGAVVQARKGALRALLLLSALPDGATLTGYQWRDAP